LYITAETSDQARAKVSSAISNIMAELLVAKYSMGTHILRAARAEGLWMVTNST
jgi:hypothetical protein